ncbi:MAG: hypothetical protein BWY09_00805 [Candidatus Hydrogenedentes bacterium ADurb.Bin179]|nr:MAG: hypothetical protein BWY09_00805 [Candidatus Hydrogenedentes bacterium ADurb.Bin179]
MIFEYLNESSSSGSTAVVDSARKKPCYWHNANNDKERRSGILTLCIKTGMRAAVTMEAARCRFYDLAISYVQIYGEQIPCIFSIENDTIDILPVCYE